MEKISLFVNYYYDAKRQNEIDFCFEQNINNKIIDHIFVLYEPNVVIPQSNKIIGVPIDKRPTFNDFFSIANLIGGVKIICNSDIYFDNTLRLAQNIKEKQVYALCRWDVKNGEQVFFNKRDSQDAWIYKGIANPDANFTMGVMGADNVLAYELDKCGFNVLSPSKEIQAIHYHEGEKDYKELQKTSLTKTREFKTLQLMEFKNPEDYTILFKFPIRQRKDKFFSTLNKYYCLMSDNPKFKFIITMDLDDKEMNTKEVREKLSEYKNLSYFYENSKSKIEAINANMPNEGWDIVVLVSDDMIPQVKNYDKIIRERMAEYFTDTDGVLWFNDGSKNAEKLNTLCVLGNKYYSRFNYIYYPHYKSYWCDLEFQNVADKLNRQVYFDECIIRHEHPIYGYGTKDELYLSQEQNYIFDKQLYNARMKNEFNESIPKIAYFIWSKGTPLSYFRYLTLETFRKHHPDYEMKLYLSDAIKEKNWNGVLEQEYYKDTSKIKDYLPKAKGLDVEVIEYCKYNHLNPTQIADLFRFEQLNETGGWFFDLDQIILKPISEELRNSNFVFGGKKIPYIGVIGAIKGSLSCKEMVRLQQEALNGKLTDYQSLGNILFHQYIANSKETINQVDDSVFYPIFWDNVGGLYEGKYDLLTFDSIAVHWHGGYAASQRFNSTYTEELSMTSNDSISMFLRGEKKDASKERKITEEIFKNIIDNNKWNGKESVSGTGSNLIQTATIIEKLPTRLRKAHVNSFLDIPCGDYYWMKKMDLDGIKYIGADIVESLIKKNKENYKGVSFEVLDIITSELPKVDVIFCRDCFVHLSFSEIQQAIKNCKYSGSKYLITTSFRNVTKNVDIKTGDWRPINLEIAPFNLKAFDYMNENCTEYNGKFGDKSLLFINLNKL